MRFYTECKQSDKLPPTIPVMDMSKFFSSINENQNKLNMILSSVFNRSQEVPQKNPLKN